MAVNNSDRGLFVNSRPTRDQEPKPDWEWRAMVQISKHLRGQLDNPWISPLWPSSPLTGPGFCVSPPPVNYDIRRHTHGNLIPQSVHVRELILSGLMTIHGQAQYTQNCRPKRQIEMRERETGHGIVLLINHITTNDNIVCLFFYGTATDTALSICWAVLNETRYPKTNQK